MKHEINCHIYFLSGMLILAGHGDEIKECSGAFYIRCLILDTSSSVAG